MLVRKTLPLAALLLASACAPQQAQQKPVPPLPVLQTEQWKPSATTAPTPAPITQPTAIATQHAFPALATQPSTPITPIPPIASRPATPPLPATAPTTQQVATIDFGPAQPESPATRPAPPPSALATAATAPTSLPAAIRPISTAKASILDFGAKPDGTTLNTAAIQKTIDSLTSSGGTVIIPKGTFLSGALFLKPGINIHLDDGAILKGSTNIKDFPLTRTRIEGHFQEWVPALINADAADGLRIDGTGTLDGSGEPYWAAFRSAILLDRTTKNLDVPRPRLLFISNSRDVHIAGIHLLNSGFWNLHLYKCQQVTVDGLDIRAGAGSPSTDGIDIDSSQSITITNTFISNNDDCIALKGTKGVHALDDKDSPPVEHIRVSNCTFAMGNGLITCGSEATIVRDVVVDHCTIAGPNSRGIAMLRLKLRTDTPQTYEDIHFTDITLDGTGSIIGVAPWTQYQDLQGQPPPTHTIRNITLTNIKGTFGTLGTIRGNTGDSIENLTLENIDVKLTTAPPANALGPTKNLTIKNVKFNGADFKTP